MPATGGSLELGSVVGGYRIDQLVGRGGMGVVYRATNVALGRIYALKVLAPELAGDGEFRERFRREMQIAASLRHPNVVGIHYAGEMQGLLFFVMDFISGDDLHEVMRQSGALEPSRAIALLTQLASALDAAHGSGLVHRDVKPENVLITVRDGGEHAYLTDFGLAKKLDAASGLAGLTREGAVVGTVHYMSPEQIIGGHTDARTDIYALGCVLFTMLTGRVPYERSNSVATMFAHVQDPAPRLTQALCEQYPTFAAVLEKAMAKEPADRYLSAGDFARDAAAALSGKRYTGGPTVVATGDASPSRGETIAERTGPQPEAPRRTDKATAGDHQAAPLAGAAAATQAGAETEVAPPAAPSIPALQAPPHRQRGARPPATPPAAGGAPGDPPRRRLGRYRWVALALLVCVAGGVAAVVALSSSSSSTRSVFAATARPVPTNRVTGSGTATLQLQGDVATVTVDTNGLLNALHWMHIHGGTGTCPTASAAQTQNGHRFINASTGDSVYGPPVTSLTTTGDTSVQSHLDTIRYEKTGGIRYKRTITLPVAVVKEIRAGLAVIVVHGIDYNHSGVYDSSLGLGAERAAPALCGALSSSQTASAGTAGSRTVFVASLGVIAGSPTGESSGVPLVCHLTGGAVTLPYTRAEPRVRGST
jgi:Protein kinase domain